MSGVRVEREQLGGSSHRVTDMLRSAHADGVGAVVWFEFDKETDWRLGGDPASAGAAQAVLGGRGWRQGGNLAAVEQLADR